MSLFTDHTHRLWRLLLLEVPLLDIISLSVPEGNLIKIFFKSKISQGTSLAIQWLRLCTSTAECVSLICGWGTKIPHAMRCSQTEKWTNKNLKNKTNLRCSRKSCDPLRHRYDLVSLLTVPSLPGYVCAQSCLTLCDPKDCSLPGSSVYGISQAGILEWVAIPFPRGSSSDLPGIKPTSPWGPASLPPALTSYVNLYLLWSWLVVPSLYFPIICFCPL